MRRADRLFQIVQLVRGRRLSTAAWLAQRLEVSERTVYRDVADLQAQGVPIEGEAGVGYRLGRGFDLPPLMFSAQEAQSLVACVRMAQAWQDPALAQASQVALGKVLSVLPPAARAAAQAMAVFAPPIGLEPAVRTPWRVCAARRTSANACCSLTRTPANRCQGAPCGRWPASSGARSGRWPPGVRRARTSAAFASTASGNGPWWRAPVPPSMTRPARRWVTFCGASRLRASWAD